MRAIRSNTKKYLFLLMVGLAATMLGITACGGDDEKIPAGQYGGTLTVTTFGTHTSLDPPFQVTQSDIIVTPAHLRQPDYDPARPLVEAYAGDVMGA